MFYVQYQSIILYFCFSIMRYSLPIVKKKINYNNAHTEIGTMFSLVEN